MRSRRDIDWVRLTRMAKRSPDALEVLQDAIEESFPRQLDSTENDAVLSSAMEGAPEWVVVFDAREAKRARHPLTAYGLYFVRRWGIANWRHQIIVWSTKRKKRVG